jgi:demethylmenaquinone methyltransferase/2-methoxy-6-polyprenyl-1,4-benzoquinol methylase
MAEKTEEYVRRVFSGINQSYDRLDSLISLFMDNRWRKQIIRLLEVDDAATVLDCGAGTGKLTELLQRRFAGIHTISLDITEDMFRPERNQTTRFIKGSAESMPLEDHSIDAVVSAYMTRTLVRIDNYFSESYRVLKPGGRLVNMDIFNPSIPVFSQFFSIYFYKLVPVLGNFLSGTESYSYLARSVKTFYSPSEVKAKLEKAGFMDVKCSRIMLGSVFIHTGIKP